MSRSSTTCGNASGERSRRRSRGAGFRMRLLDHELKRLEGEIPHIHLKHAPDRGRISETQEKLRFCRHRRRGAETADDPRARPRTGRRRPRFPPRKQARSGQGRESRSSIIGAGNVGCDAAAEASRLGAKEITLIDIQEPASFGVEGRQAEAAGAKFLWPRFTKAITEKAWNSTRRRDPPGGYGDRGRRRSAGSELPSGGYQDRKRIYHRR